MAASQFLLFKETLRNLLPNLIQIEPSFEEIFIREMPFHIDELSVMLGVTGDSKGQVIFSLNEKLAIKMASGLLEGYLPEALDELVGSAVGEIGNMVMGNVCTAYEQTGVKMDISPPSVIVGEKIQVNQRTVTHCLPVVIGEYGTLYIDIALTN